MKKGNEERITSNSRASIGSLSLLGEPVIDISPTTDGTPLKDGDYIPAGRTPGQLADVAETARVSLDSVNGLLQDIRAGKGTVGKLFSDDQLYKEITKFVNAAEGVTDHLRDGRGTLGMLIKDPAAYQRLNASLESLQEIARGIRAGEGTLGKLVTGRHAGQIADRQLGEPRGGHRPAAAQRQQRGQAVDRKGAVRPLQLHRAAFRHRSPRTCRRPRARPGNCCRTRSCMRT